MARVDIDLCSPTMKREMTYRAFGGGMVLLAMFLTAFMVAGHIFGFGPPAMRGVLVGLILVFWFEIFNTIRRLRKIKKEEEAHAQISEKARRD